MKIRKHIVMLGVILLFTYFSMTNILATQTLTLPYVFDVHLEENIIHRFNDVSWDSIMIQFETNEISTCKFDKTSGKSYDHMEGTFKNYGTLHEKSFFDIEKGIFSIYVLCKYNDEYSQELNLKFYANPLVSAKIFISEKSPLKAGKYEIEIITSRSLSKIPEIQYSFDGIEYEPFPVQGSQQNWKGYLIISKDIGEAIGSFSFKGTDLEGRIGTKISYGEIFVVDTVRPGIIQGIKGEGKKEETFLEWYFEEDVKEFNIYRSKFSSVDKSDFYRSVKAMSFSDTFVDGGKTYYYRVAAVDEAGNIGDLSRTIEITALREEASADSTGLAPALISRVENLLVEIENVHSDIKNIETLFKNFEETKKDVAEKVGLFEELNRAISNLNSIKREAELYKTQSLSENELDNKLSSSRIKLANLRRNVPESFTIKQEISLNQKFNEEDIERLYLETIPNIVGDFDRNMVKKSLSLINEKDFSAETKGFNLEIDYMDGSKKDLLLVMRKLGGTFDRDDKIVFVEKIPREMARGISELSIRNRNFDEVKDSIIAFPSDTKEIIYFIEEDVDLNVLEDVLFSVLYKGEETSDWKSITGYFTFVEISEELSIGIILITIALIVIGYFGFIKYKNQSLKKAEEIIQKSNKARSLASKGHSEKAIELYQEISKEYKSLPHFLKSKIYKDLEKLRHFIKESK